jgi:hypothetical protein
MLHRGVAAAELSNISLLMYFYGQNSLAGSSLQVMGLHGSKRDLGQAQWSVMGGTGDISMARGIINYNITEEDSASRTFKICIYVYYTPMENILVSARCIFICCHYPNFLLPIFSSYLKKL